MLHDAKMKILPHMNKFFQKIKYQVFPILHDFSLFKQETADQK